MASGTQSDKAAHAGNPKPSCSERIAELEEMLAAMVGDYMEWERHRSDFVDRAVALLGQDAKSLRWQK